MSCTGHYKETDMEESKEVKILVVVENTKKDSYGLFTDKIIYLEQEGNKIIMNPEDLRNLEKAIGAKFRM